MFNEKAPFGVQNLYNQNLRNDIKKIITNKTYLVTPDELPAGRPAPYMIYKNMINLAIPSVDMVVKVGDTIADIKEGVNAKVWSVGVITGSNEMGLTEAEYNSRPASEWNSMKTEVRERMMAAGANFVLDSIADLPACIEHINQIMNKG